MTSIMQQALYKKKKQAKTESWIGEKQTQNDIKEDKPKNDTLSTLNFGASIMKGNTEWRMGRKKALLDMLKVPQNVPNILGERGMAIKILG